jgi:Fur family transcriptional regulator, ferric uptake regulator
MSDPKAHFIQYVKDHGLKWSKQREHLFDLFASAGGHVTADEFYKLALKDFPCIGYATVYRTLRLLSESGLATAARFGHKSARYENARKDRHHDHMVCTGCGGIIEFSSAQIEKLQDAVARQQGFSITHHKMVLYGTCRKCAQKKK